VFPSPLFNYLPDASHAVGRVNLGDSTVRQFIFFLKSANFSDVIVTHNSIRFSDTFNALSLVISSTFFVFIRHVFRVCAKEKVFRVDASRCVTAMKNIQPIRYIPNVQRIANTVGKYLGFSSSFTYHAVAFVVFIRLPQMASVRNFNLDFKSVFKSRYHKFLWCFRVFTHYTLKQVGG